jgi:alpha-1,6-mannosyltransferase
VKVPPEQRVYILGATSLVVLTICSHNFGDRGGPYFMASLTVAGIAYLLAILEFFSAPTFPRRVVVIGLAMAAVWHVEFLRVPPDANNDDDIRRYVWDGRLQRLGYNPYLVVPSDPAVKGLHTPETRNLNNPDLQSPYPAGAQLFFRAVTAIHESVFAFKVAFLICDFGIALVLLDMLRVGGRSPHMVLVYAWNPLLAIEVAGSGHIDIIGALLLVISVASLAHRWRATAALTLGLAVAVKFLPIVLVPLYWKRVRIRDAALAAAVVGLLYVPFLDRSFLNHGRVPIGSLGTYVTGFRFNGPVFGILHHGAPPQLLAGLAVLVGLVTATWLRRNSTTHVTTTPAVHRAEATDSTHRTGEPPVPGGLWLDAFAWPLAATLLCAPVVFPWYLLWLLPFLTSAPTLLLTVWTVSIIPTYIMWRLRTFGRPWGALPVWVMLVEYGCVAMAAAIVALRRMRQD